MQTPEEENEDGGEGEGRQATSEMTLEVSAKEKVAVVVVLLHCIADINTTTYYIRLCSRARGGRAPSSRMLTHGFPNFPRVESRRRCISGAGRTFVTCVCVEGLACFKGEEKVLRAHNDKEEGDPPRFTTTSRGMQQNMFWQIFEDENEEEEK